MTYSPKAYWTERGRTHEAEALRDGWWDAESEPLFDLLSTLNFSSVLDVGCGFGRIGASILSRWPDVAYTGIDVSPDLIDGARKRLPDAELICADLATWDTERSWDLVLAYSVLGHLRPEDIVAVIAKLRRWARKDLVTADWNEVGASTAYQFGHDYRELYGGAAQSTRLGRLTMWYVHD